MRLACAPGPADRPEEVRNRRRPERGEHVAEHPALRPDAGPALTELLNNRILVLDGAMGTMIQRYTFSEAEYRGERYADWGQDLKGNNDLLSLTQPDAISEIHRAYLGPDQT